MTTSTTAADTSRLEHIPVEQIDPDPMNRKVSVDKEFIASVREHGVLEPILVVPHPDDSDRFLIVAGERRWRAAGRVKLTAIPAVIRVDMDERARVEAQVSENLHRTDLAPCEEAVQLIRLVELGHTVKSLSAAVGRSQGHVRTRLKLAELPKAAQKLIDAGDWSIEEGLAALKLIDHPEDLASIIADRPLNVGYAVEKVLTRVQFDAALADLQQRVERDQLRVLDDLPRAAARLSALGISSKDHVSEECHAHIISGDRQWSKKPELVGVCTKPNRHRVEGPSEVKAPHRPGKTQQDRDEAAAKRDAKAARQAAMASMVKGRIGKGDCYNLILSAFFDSVGHETAATVCELLEVKGRTTNGVANPVSDLRKFAARSEPNRLRAAVAIAMVEHELRLLQWGSAETSALWLEWLAARGYEPTDWDHQHVAAKKRR